MGRLDGKVALVTGAASGMGLTETQLFSEEGAKVIALDIQFDLLQEKVNEICSKGGDAIALRLDVTSAISWEDIVNKTIDKYGKIDILVNNAGIHIGKTLLETDLNIWEKTMDVNAKGVFLGMKYVAPEMIKNGAGSIINISSLGGLLGGIFADGDDAAYSASKGAVRSITKHAAQVLAKNNIRVNTVHPGGIKTPMAELLIKENPEVVARTATETPLPPHMAETMDIAYGVLYLASDEARFVTGIELIIDGGFTSH